jgi:hypothetical protein
MVNSSLYNLFYKGGQNGGSKIKSTFKNLIVIEFYLNWFFKLIDLKLK